MRWRNADFHPVRNTVTQWLAVDAGNSRVKAGLFELAESGLPRCLKACAAGVDQPLDWSALLSVEEPQTVTSIIAGSSQTHVDRIRQNWPKSWPEPLLVRSSERFPLTIDVEEPRRVGLDRLLTAIAANRIRTAQQPVVVVDCGTATTINLIDTHGTFRGGAILPGFLLCAKALHHYTEVLPLLAAEQIIARPPGAAGHPVLGRNTEQAMLSGIFWGQIGAIREIAARLQTEAGCVPLMLLTGGGAALLEPHFPDARYEPHLALQGLVLVASGMTSACRTSADDSSSC